MRLTSLNSVSVLIRMLGGFLSGKMIASFLGPAGMSLTGNLRNFLTMVDAYATIGIQNGIIKYTATAQDRKEELSKVISTVFITMLFSGIVSGFVIALPATFWSTWIFNGATSYAWIFRVLGIAMPLYIGNVVFMNMLNGLGRYNRVILINTVANAIGVGGSALLIWKYGVDGAFLGLIFSPVVAGMLAFFPLYKSIGGFSLVSFDAYSSKVLKDLSAYSFMTLLAALLVQGLTIFIRNRITDTSGMTESGFYEGINRISSFYIIFASTLQGVYFLPMLSRAKDNEETKKIWRSYYKVIVPVFAAGLLLVYVLRRFVIHVTLTDEFLPMEKLFVWQLTGDLFKVSSQILAQEFFARRMAKQFAISEIGSVAITITTGYYLIDLYGAEGAVMAHCITYFVYLAVMLVYFRKKLF